MIKSISPLFIRFIRYRYINSVRFSVQLSFTIYTEHDFHKSSYLWKTDSQVKYQVNI